VSKNKSILILTIIAILIIIGTVFAFVSLDNGELGIYNYIAYPKAIKQGLDLKGGVYAVYEANDPDTTNLSSRLEGTAKSIQDLLYSKGYTEAVVAVQTGNRIRVEVPDVENPEQIFDLIGRPASLEFKSPEGDVLLTGKDLEEAYVSTNEEGQYVIAIKFNKEGTDKFADATSKYLNKEIGIYIAGEEVMTPTVESVISGGQAIIEGNYTYDTASEMAVKIQAGAFDVLLKMIESKTLSPSLGKGALKGGLIAGAIALAFIIIFLIVLYRMLGVAASIALILFTMTQLFFFSIFPWVQLTLPGIAGIIVGIGMAVDANVIINERIKDEYRKGKNLNLAVKEGFKKSISAIVDGNVTTMIGCIVMLAIGSATIKGFGTTLLIGIILSMIFALIVSYLIIRCFISLSNNNEKLYNLSRAEEVKQDVK
jgi:preprotein translocase subunit SecD